MLREETFPVFSWFCYVYEDSVNVEVKDDVLGFLTSCQLITGLALDKCAMCKTLFKMKLLLGCPTGLIIMYMVDIFLRASIKYVAITFY